MKKPLIVLAGPTCVGKTSLSIQLAKALDGEIISADSMQVYRHMDIGSAKVTKEEMDGITHHLIDILEPFEPFNVVLFQQKAKEALEEIYSRNKMPILVGGTGFYIQALLYDIDFTPNEEDDSIRKELEELGDKMGEAYLYQMLEEVDPKGARELHANNKKRVIRAIEFFRQTGQRISEHNEVQRQKDSPYQVFYYVLNRERSQLYEQIEYRVDGMVEMGLVEEVKYLISMGVKKHMVSMQGLGYKEILGYLEGDITLEEAVYQIKRDTRHFAKRQITWFKREREVRWINLEEFEFDQQAVLEKILVETQEYRS